MLDNDHVGTIKIILSVAGFDLLISMFLEATFDAEIPECRLAHMIKGGNIMLAPPFILFGIACLFFAGALYNAPFSRHYAREPGVRFRHRAGFPVIRVESCFSRLIWECSAGLVYCSTFLAKVAAEFLTDDLEVLHEVRAVASFVAFSAAMSHSF